MPHIVIDLVSGPLTSSGLTQVKAVCVPKGCNYISSTRKWRAIMKAMVDLFSTDYGLFSVGVLAFIVVMAIWFYRFFTRKMAESEAQQR